MTTQRPSAVASTAVVAVGAALAGALVWRTVKRRQSPVIHCRLSCKCGQVQGQIAAKKEDSIRIWCFCQDCRDYAAFVAAQGDKNDTIVGEYGESRLVQVCKSDLTIAQGREHLQLSRKSATPNKQQIYMHRYYAKCCSTPLFQTVDFLGFVGVFLNTLDPEDAIDQFDGPVAMMPERAVKPPTDMPPNVSAPHFLWKLLRYHSSRKMGPFDYDMEPTYWGDQPPTQTR